LISKIIICLFLTFLLGLVIGWLLRNQITRNREDVLIADVEGQMETIEKLERERLDIRRKLQNMERANVDLNSKILSITSEGNPLFYTQDSLTTDFNSLSEHQQILDSDRNDTLNESDDLMFNLDHEKPSTVGASTDNENDQTVQEIEEVIGEWDPLTAELDKLSVSLSGADIEARTLTSENDIIDEEPTNPTKEKEQSSEAQSQPTLDSEVPRESNRTEQESGLFDEKSYRLNTGDDEVDDHLKSDSIKADMQETATNPTRKPQNPSTTGLFDSNPLSEDTLVLETIQTENPSDLPPRSGDYDIEEIEGIGKGYAERLRKINIATTRQLLDKASNSAIITQIASQVNKKEKLIQSWISMADLIRVPGVRGKFAELIAATGVKSVQQLAVQEAPELTKNMAYINASENRNRTTPSIDMVMVWIAAANGLPSIINTKDW
jgi:hypothetical protein